eukprot:2654-Heterococcus_DN1.PRE.1
MQNALQQLRVVKPKCIQPVRKCTDAHMITGCLHALSCCFNPSTASIANKSVRRKSDGFTFLFCSLERLCAPFLAVASRAA